MHRQTGWARLLRRASAGTALGMMAVSVAVVGVSSASPGQAGTHTSAASDAVLKRGEYLLAFGGCDDCHTPLKMGPRGPESDMSRRLSGHPAAMKLGPVPALPNGWMFAGDVTSTAFAGPWGTSYTINLTPDPSGLGDWTEEMFKQAMRTGRHAGNGRPILPPMPWRAVGSLSDADLHALFTALRHLPPVKNVAPPSVPAAPPSGGR